MTSRDEVLRTKTYKNEVETISERVFHTLRDGDTLMPNGTTHRTALLVAYLVEHLHESGQLSGEAVDEGLLRTLG